MRGILSFTVGLWLLMPLHVHAVGEILKVETSGTQYCGDFDLQKFNAGNNVDLWIRLDSDTDLTLSTSASFAPGTTYPLLAQTYSVSSKANAVIGGNLFEDGSFGTFQGVVKLSKSGTPISARGTFIQSGLLDLDCFSSGKFTAR